MESQLVNAINGLMDAINGHIYVPKTYVRMPFMVMVDLNAVININGSH
jgi:hypothetical protein